VYGFNVPLCDLGVKEPIEKNKITLEKLVLLLFSPYFVLFVDFFFVFFSFLCL